MFNFDKDLQVIRHYTPSLDNRTGKPFVVMMSALPAAGKTYIARHLCTEFNCVHLESDFLRNKLIGSTANHGYAEDTRLFRAILARGEELVQEGNCVVFDSTNLREHHRQRIYDIAQRTGTPLFIFKLECDLEEIKKRLKKRWLDPKNNSQADYEVYLELSLWVEPIKHRHMLLNGTDKDARETAVAIIRKGLKEYDD